MDNLIIQIFKNSNNEYEFNIYDGYDVCEMADPLDGGICTSSMKNAIEMACDTAKDLASRIKKDKVEPEREDLSSPAMCPECGSKATYNNSSGELQCDNCGHSETE